MKDKIIKIWKAIVDDLKANYKIAKQEKLCIMPFTAPIIRVYKSKKTICLLLTISNIILLVSNRLWFKTWQHHSGYQCANLFLLNVFHRNGRLLSTYPRNTPRSTSHARTYEYIHAALIQGCFLWWLIPLYQPIKNNRL